MRARIPNTLAKAALFAWLSVGSTAHDVITTPITFSREISRLLYDRCIACHRPGGSAFPLLTYQQTRPWAAAIKEEVLERRMPPWGAVKGFGEFRHDGGLTQEQLGLIAEWVEGGAPEGDPALLPKQSDVAAEAAPARQAEIALAGGQTLRSSVTLSGIRPANLREGTSVKVIARRPDGSIEPLLWLYQFNPRFQHAYWYEVPVRLPSGTRVEAIPPNTDGTIFLIRR